MTEIQTETGAADGDIRALITSRAEQDAIEQLSTGIVRPNPFAGSAHEAQYAAALARYLLLHSAGADCESGA